MIAEIQGGGGRAPIKLWTQPQEVEHAALDQLRKIASLPWVYRHVAVMPDVHLGKGATVGSVIAMKEAVSPAAVGVDIGCGMLAVKTSLTADQLPDNLSEIRSMIEAAIPVGNGPGGCHAEALRVRRSSHDVFERSVIELFETMPEVIRDREGTVASQLGTLGGGNHFVELCVDKGGRCTECEGSGTIVRTEGLGPGFFACDECGGSGVQESRVWLMLHSGSRNAGKTIAEAHLRVAQKLEHNRGLPDQDLAVFLSNTPEMQAYREDLFWAQRYAWLNREAMLRLYRSVIERAFTARGLNVTFGETVQCHHNYVAEEVHFGEEVFVTRKGAISAREGELGIIPGSMGTRSYIVRGKGNPESYHSASHGAGRRMSRGAAKRKFTLEDLAEQTAGVECRKDGGVLDEIPGAYKDIDDVMANQRDLVEVVAELKAVICVKG